VTIHIRHKDGSLEEFIGPPTEFQSARSEAESRMPFLKSLRNVKIGDTVVPLKGGKGEFFGEGEAGNPFPGFPSIAIGKDVRGQEGGMVRTIINDMVHAAAMFSPEFKALKVELRDSLSPGEIDFAKKRYESEYKGKATGSNFATFDNFLDTFWIDGMVQHLLDPVNSEIDQIKGGNPRAVPVLEKIKELFLGEPKRTIRK